MELRPWLITEERQLARSPHTCGAPQASKGGKVDFMLVNEWLEIGYDKGIIDEIPVDSYVSFATAYTKWFSSKMNTIKPQSLDRIEVTYNKYLKGSEFENMPIHTVDEKAIYTFLNNVIITYGNINKKEYDRIYQIVNNVMYYAFDIDIGYCHSVNWDIVKRHIAVDNIIPSRKKEYAISDTDKNKLFRAVLIDNIYPRKRCASLCVCLNFYLGLRIGELAALSWKDVDLAGKYVYIHTTETKSFSRDDDGCRMDHINYNVQDTTKTVYSVRKIPLIPESIYIIKLIKAYQQQRGYDSDFLAYDGSNTILSKSLERTIYKLCELCDISRFSSHKIRKTFASELHKNGVPSKVISDLMGHSDIRTTEKYYILNYEDSFGYLRQLMQKSLKVNVENC